MLQDNYMLIYALKVWLTSLAATSLLIVLWGLHIHIKHDPRLYMMLIGLNIGQSIPAGVGIAIAGSYLKKRIPEIGHLKIILSLVAMVLSCALFWLINDMKLNLKSADFFLGYGSVTVIFIWVYKLKSYIDEAPLVSENQQDI